MARDKAQSVKEESQVTRTQAAEPMDDEQLKDLVAGLDDEESKSLVPVFRNLPASLVERVVNLMEGMNPNQAGLEEMEGGWTPPIIKMRQPMSSDAPKTVEMGGLYTDDGEVLPNPFRFVPLYMHPAHVKFTEGESTPDCRSEDGIMSIFGKLCKDCEDEPWKHGEATDCNKFRYTYVFDTDFKRIYKLQLGKTSYRTGSKLLKWMRGSGKHVYSKIYSLTTKEVERKGGGVYYVFDIDATGDKIEDPNLLEIGHVLSTKIKKAREDYLASLRERQQKAGEHASRIIERSDGDVVTPASADEPDFSKDGSL